MVEYKYLADQTLGICLEYPLEVTSILFCIQDRSQIGPNALVQTPYRDPTIAIFEVVYPFTNNQ